jgi:hypothetical protein
MASFLLNALLKLRLILKHAGSAALEWRKSRLPLQVSRALIMPSSTRNFLQRPVHVRYFERG